MSKTNSKPESEYIYDCIIIGGGISGISFAHYLSNIQQKILIIEKEDEIGGQIQTHITQSENNYWNELGAHTCYNSYTGLLAIAKDIDEYSTIQPTEKLSYVLYNSGKIKSVLSELSLLRMMINGPKLFFSSRTGKTVKEYFRPIVGKYNYDHLFTNLFKAVISQDADSYPAEIFLKRRNGRIKEVVKKYTFKNGLLSFLKSIIEKDNMNIKKSIQVTDITIVQSDKNDHLFKIDTLQGESFYSRNVALATDPQTASLLLKKIEDPLSDLLNTIPLFHSDSLNVVVKKEDTSIKNIAGIIPLSGEFLSVVSRDTVPHPHLRGFTFHFEKKNEEEKQSIISQVLNIPKEKIIETKSTSHILPSLRKEHLGMSKQVIETKKNPYIYMLGNYFYGLSLEDCISQSADEFERYKKLNG